MAKRKSINQPLFQEAKYNVGNLIDDFLSAIRYNGEDFVLVDNLEALTLNITLAGIPHDTTLRTASESDLRLAKTHIYDHLSARRTEICSKMDSLNSALTEAVERLQRIHDSNTPLQFDGLPTGFVDLDAALQGLDAGDLIIIACRPGMGKTTFALNIVEYLAQEFNYGVAIFSTEANREEIARRMLSSSGRLSSECLRTGRLSDNDWSKLSYALGKLHELPIHISSKVGLTIDAVCERARTLAKIAGQPLKLIVVDRIQGLASSIDQSSRSIELEVIATRLKALGMELGCAVIATSSLNRSLESRIDKRPLLQDLRDSGGLEDEADIVLFLYRTEYYKPDAENRGIAEIIVGKNRRRALSTTKLAYLAEYFRFENLVSWKND